MADGQEIEMVKRLGTVVERNATDLHLAAGQPPVLRIGGRMERLPLRPLQGSDCVRLMQSITPESNQHKLEEKRGTDFGFAFGDQAGFRVAVFKQRGNIGLAVRRLSVDGSQPS